MTSWPVTSDVCVVDDDGVIHRQTPAVAIQRFRQKRPKIGVACGATGVPLATAAQLVGIDPVPPATVPQTVALVVSWPPPHRHPLYADDDMPITGRCRTCWEQNGKRRPHSIWSDERLTVVGPLQHAPESTDG